MSKTPMGWYDDPEQAGKERYWDGAAWTEGRRTKGAAAPPAPQVAQPAAAAPAAGAPSAGSGRYEYDTWVNKGSINMRVFAALLNTKGTEGWRLHSALEQAGNTICIFERPAK